MTEITLTRHGRAHRRPSSELPQDGDRIVARLQASNSEDSDLTAPEAVPARQPVSDTGIDVRRRVPPAPEGTGRLRWIGPGLLWMLSAVGAGSVLFTPRIGSRYEYELLWIPLVIFVFMWVMIREAARYTVVSGRTLLDGYDRLPGPRGWAVWLIFLPQLIAAVVAIGGLAALVGSALMISFPGTQIAYTVTAILLSAALVITGKYPGVEKVSQVLACGLMLTIVAAAAQVFPHPGRFIAGLAPGFPENSDIYFILPWVGYILAGAIGITWFSYWTATRGYGGGVAGITDSPEPQGLQNDSTAADASVRDRRIHDWLRITSATAAVGVIAGAFVILSFLVLGTELLAPADIFPEGIEVARLLSHLLVDIWGRAGFWVLILAIVVALGGSILANQDGWGRTFADATLILNRHRPRHGLPMKSVFEGFNAAMPVDLTDWPTLKNAYILVITTVLPILLVLVVRDPVEILSVAGIIAATHTPVIVFLTLYLNRTRLPAAFRPGIAATTLMVVSGLFYGGLAVVQVWTILRIAVGA